MGLQELINTLKKDEQKQIDDIWQAAKGEAEILREQVNDTIASIRKTHTEQLDNACQECIRSIFSETDMKTREKKLFAYQALAQILRKAAIKQLPVLREQNYEEVFTLLVDELPERQWEKIVVNPADVEMAARFFDARIIVPDLSISGGLTAITADGKITVDNTFEKRLERKWFLLLPAMLAEIEKRHDNSGSAEKN